MLSICTEHSHDHRSWSGDYGTADILPTGVPTLLSVHCRHRDGSVAAATVTDNPHQADDLAERWVTWGQRP